jgi:hypothetical protein
VLILPTDAVPPVLLQLLHLLATVHQALLQQLRQQQQGAGGTGSALCKLLAGRKEPVQIHIALQVLLWEAIPKGLAPQFGKLSPLFACLAVLLLVWLVGIQGLVAPHIRP